MKAGGAPELSVVTGAFGYTGRYIAARLLVRGERVRTLTHHPQRSNPFAQPVEVEGYHFDHPQRLVHSLRGASRLFNTYWVRFPRGEVTFERAVEHSRQLFRAAGEAGVGRVVHLSVVHASTDSPLPYFRGKAQVEDALRQSGLSHVILRPTVIFGREDILINNIAWLLRRLPVFALPGSGRYRLQPVYVDDVARLAVEAGDGQGEGVLDAAGPEIFTFEALVRLIARAVGSRSLLLHAPPGLTLLLVRLLSRLVGDVLLTREELEGLMAGLLVTDGPATARTRLSRWLEEHAGSVGGGYASELERHYR